MTKLAWIELLSIWLTCRRLPEITALAVVGEATRNKISNLRFEGEKKAEWWAAFDRQNEKERRRRVLGIPAFGMRKFFRDLSDWPSLPHLYLAEHDT